MKGKKIISCILACMLTCTTLAGCGTSPKDSGGKNEKASLEMWVYGWEKASADKIIEDSKIYGKENNIDISIIPVTNDSYTTKIQATLAGGNAPDLAFLDSGVQTTQLASKGKLLGLKEYGANDLKEKYYDSVWDSVTYKDDVYGIPITSNNLQVYYNKELFDKAGLSYPTSDWTWDDMREYAKKLTDKEKGVYGLELAVYQNGGYCWTWLPFLWTAGGEFLNEDRTKATFNNAEGVEALEFWKSMTDEGSVPIQAAPSGVDRFTSGLVGMLVDGPWMLNPYLSDPNFKDKFDIVSIPKKDASQEHSTTVIGGESVSIFSNTKYPKDAYNYLMHLTNSDFTKVFWENWITVPPQSEYKDFYADNEKYGKYIQKFSDEMVNTQARPFTPTWPQISNELNTDLQAYTFDKVDSAQKALDKAVEDIDKLLEEDK